MNKGGGDRLAIALVGVVAAASIFRNRGSSAMVDEGMVGRHWGRQGVGVLLTTGERMLLLLRSDEVLDPNVWGIPGGAVRIDNETGKYEDLYASASTEIEEETGLRLSPDFIIKNQEYKTIYQEGSFRYTTFVVRVPEAMTDQEVFLNWENDEYMWLTIEEINEISRKNKLHYGVKYTIGEVTQRHE